MGPVASLSQLWRWAAALLGMQAYSNLCVFKLDTIRQSLQTRYHQAVSSHQNLFGTQPRGLAY